ncbi:MAG: efflux RND transporter permease subunit [Candidatus Aminicenantes bacterium]|nr:efflux RND transporter permease subunit [Candidatus Aminicenantes bacterium]
MYKLARFSVKYPTTILMIVLAILLLGYISFQRLGMDLLPDLNSPKLFVRVAAGELPPEEMEKKFTSSMESQAARQKNVTNVSSVTQVGQSLITVEYAWKSDMDEAFLDLQKAMTAFSQNAAADEISVSQLDPNAQPVVVVFLSHPEISDLDQLRQTAETNIRNELIRLPGVAAVEIIGGQKREIEVKTDAYTLEAYGLTQAQLASAISNSNQNMSGGSIVEMGISYTIRGIGELKSEDDLNALIVNYITQTTETGTTVKTPIYLREVADVSTVLSDPENIVRLNGQQGLALEIFKEATANTTASSKSIHEQLDSMRLGLSGYDLLVVQDQARFIQSSIREVEQTGLIGIFLAVLVLYVFLRRIGITAVISLAIPISVVATFSLMYFNGLSLNIMTLGGLALGAGMLVDNAIVVVENITRHLEEGMSLREAAVLGTGEVGGAITSATLTTIIVFLPIVYLHGVAGELFKDQAWTVAFSLLSSLFVAMAVIPMLCSRLLKTRERTTPVKSVHFPAYGRFLSWVLKRKGVVILFALVLVGATILILPQIGSEFIPHSEQGEMFISLELPEGTDLERTGGAVKNLEAVIGQQFGDQLDFIFSKVGPAGTLLDLSSALADDNNALIQLVFNPESELSTNEITARLNIFLSELPDMDAQLVQQQTALQTTLGTSAAPLIVEIKGEELEILALLAENVRDQLSGIQELSNIEMGFQEGRPEINLEIDRTVAAQFSLTANEISSQLKNLLSGQEIGEMEDGGEFINILLSTPKVTLNTLEGVLLQSSTGGRVRLDEVARLVRTTSPREIIRNNQIRVTEIQANISGGIPFNRIVKKVEAAVRNIPMPEDYSFSITGEEKLRRESFGNLKFALLLAILLIYMVMASQFESLLHPFVILLTIPLAGVGTVLLLWLLRMPFNMMSMIGVIILAGIAVNDSIILVDRINQNRRSGMDIPSAIIDAGQTRIRPILITSVTTILALLPLTFGFGEGASLRAPMALAVIGGLVTSTTLTLVVIPAVYRIMAGKVKTT